MDHEYISVQEFADLVGVPHQTIYKKINKKDDKIKQFVKVVDGKKTISTAAADLFKNTTKELVRNECATVAQQVRNECAIIETELKSQLKSKADEYALRSEFYEKQLADRDEQIEFLKAQLAKRDEELSAQRMLTENAQKLHLVAESKIAAIEDKKSKSWFKKIFNTEAE